MSSINATSLYDPLTPYELKLAEAQRIRNAGKSFFSALSAVRNGEGNEEELATALANVNELGGIRAQTVFINNGKGFTQQEDFGFFDLTTGRFISFYADPGITDNDFNLPWMYSGIGKSIGGTDSLNNALMLTRGLSIALMYELEEEYTRLQIPIFGKGIVATDIDGNQVYSEATSKYIQALRLLINAIEGGSAPLSENTQNNNEAISLLQRAGIDTSRTFWINGIGFEVINGVIQKSDVPFNPIEQEKYSPPAGFFDYSHEELDLLLERAYAQGMLQSIDKKGIELYA